MKIKRSLFLFLFVFLSVSGCSSTSFQGAGTTTSFRGKSYDNPNATISELGDYEIKVARAIAIRSDASGRREFIQAVVRAMDANPNEATNIIVAYATTKLADSGFFLSYYGANQLRSMVSMVSGLSPEFWGRKLNASLDVQNFNRRFYQY